LFLLGQKKDRQAPLVGRSWATTAGRKDESGFSPFRFDDISMSQMGRFCCKSRKSNDPENLAKVDPWTFLLLRRF